jgi:hypothetical protein
MVCVSLLVCIVIIPKNDSINIRNNNIDLQGRLSKLTVLRRAKPFDDILFIVFTINQSIFYLTNTITPFTFSDSDIQINMATPHPLPFASLLQGVNSISSISITENAALFIASDTFGDALLYSVTSANATTDPVVTFRSKYRFNPTSQQYANSAVTFVDGSLNKGMHTFPFCFDFNDSS